MSAQVLKIEHEIPHSSGMFGGNARTEKILIVMESDALSNPHAAAELVATATSAVRSIARAVDEEAVEATVTDDDDDDDEQPGPSPEDEAEMDATRGDGHEMPIVVELPNETLVALSNRGLVPVPAWAVTKYMSRGVLAKSL